jgi:hypothetical protein
MSLDSFRTGFLAVQSDTLVASSFRFRTGATRFQRLRFGRRRLFGDDDVRARTRRVLMRRPSLGQHGSQDARDDYGDRASERERERDASLSTHPHHA